MNKKLQITALIIFVLICGIAGGLLGATKGTPQKRTFEIKARKYAFKPNVIRVNKGDEITLKLTSTDVTHGIYFEAYDFDAKIRPETPYFWVRHPSKDKRYGTEPVETYTFIADKVGKFRYRCSIGCGPMHPFMLGEMIVGPNYLFPASIGLAVGIALACITYFFRKKEE